MSRPFSSPAPQDSHSICVAAHRDAGVSRVPRLEPIGSSSSRPNQDRTRLPCRPGQRPPDSHLRGFCCGTDRHAIAPAIRELEALGFLEVTEHGRAGNAEFRPPNGFRRTFRPTEAGDAADEWRRIETVEKATAIAKAALKSARTAVKKEKLTHGLRPLAGHRNGKAGMSRLRVFLTIHDQYIILAGWKFLR
jgi:hypothetical protein